MVVVLVAGVLGGAGLVIWLVLKILRGMDAATDVRAGEVVTMLLPLKFLTAEDAVKVLQPVVSIFGAIARMNASTGSRTSAS